jgi:hypothetical protein
VSGKYKVKGIGSTNLGGDFYYSTKFTNLIFLYLFPYIYEKNSEFFKKEEVFRKVTIRKGIGRKEISKGRKKLERKPLLFGELYEPYLFTLISLYI